MYYIISDLTIMSKLLVLENLRRIYIYSIFHEIIFTIEYLKVRFFRSFQILTIKSSLSVYNKIDHI